MNLLSSYPFETVVTLVEGRVWDQIEDRVGTPLRNRVGEQFSGLLVPIVDQTLIVIRESES